MDEKERERRKEMSKYIGPRELFKLGGLIMGWIFLGVIISLFLTLVLHVKEEIGTAVFSVFILTLFAFPFVGYYWKPANFLMNKVIGNKNLNIPILPPPTGRFSFKKYPWFYYLPSLWGWLMLIALVYVVIRYLVK